ncbi:hypothetical protein JEQ12_017473 [Ovis aries]|uniref:Uncharacterized protein n=1 Tax=Ovis aries TaxID=9940 RepID=A0A836D0U1_SHEEP|nr:hypothetical protein JEQ12_017473 [Ovis aries]
MVAVTGIVVAAEAAFPVVATDLVLAPKAVESDEGVVASVGVVMASSVGLVALGVGFVVPLLMVKVLDSIVEVEIPCVVVAALGEAVVASRDVVTVTDGTVLTLVVAPTPGVVEAAVVTAAGPLATVVVAETVVLTAGGVESTTEDVGFSAVGVAASAGSGVEDPAVVATVDMKTVSEVVESVAPVVTSSSEIVVATAVAVSSTDSAISSFTRIASSGVTSSPASRVVSPTCVVAVPVSESSEVTPGAAVVAVVRNIVEPAPGLMEVVELEAVDSCDVDFTEGATDTVPGADAAVVEAASIAELAVDVIWLVVAATEDRVSDVLVVASDPLVVVVGPLVVMTSGPIGLIGDKELLDVFGLFFETDCVFTANLSALGGFTCFLAGVDWIFLDFCEFFLAEVLSEAALATLGKFNGFLLEEDRGFLNAF